MRRDDPICPKCGAGFRRLELESARREKGEYRCPSCNHLLEVFDGSTLVVYRLTVQPSLIRALRELDDDD